MGSSETLSADLLIVGAGPTGLYAAYYAGFRGLSTVIVDSLPEAGGQITAMYPEKMIHDVAGFPAVRGRELVNALVEQASQWNPTYLLGQQADKLHTGDDGLVVGLASGMEVHAGAVLVTAGIGEFTPRPLPAGQGWLGRGLVYFIPALDAHAGQDVVVVGGGDSAFDWALALRPIASSVTLVHRRARFRAAESTVRQAYAEGVRVITDAEVTALRGDATGGLAEVDVRLKSGERLSLPAQTVVAALGFTADLGPLESWGLEIERRTIRVDTTMATSRERVYAAGDVVSYPGKVRLIATGFGEAATAVNNIAVALDPSAKLFPGHSTDV
ncbi:NAD(P)/FAD-dependent oxidoreductase [Saccharomonospora viridis]|jgi:thioredoxin reductase|uniref:Ferredoxin--NADP reductase n=2 Tax=Saccharomonospora viridis TaxID=1852 RepID=C7MYN7_SACVD|nr:NAD(P)/FAD-dependent oxidoreductase [Saccharomonospora viridis]ACU98126.1 thioredoxin reductase [Saccharomonospora viridis DSM 43017]KHF46114.1 ferredoxin--NADP reductase [Saccharomonospora viridis]SFP34620.1 thioredoxin reductase (NADPH) [Saccharomonospora viridis]